MNLIVMDSTKEEPLYIQVYQHYKAEIEQNRLQEGEKLPSIRELANNISVSKTTVEKAYQQLVSEGYIENCDRSRYTVNRVESIPFKLSHTMIVDDDAVEQGSNEGYSMYDFSSGEMDSDGYDFSLWKRYISKVFLDKERLIGYGHNKGEEELRKQIAKYIKKSRGVYARSEQIIIGPGVQSLLNTLCSILKLEHSSIAFEDPGFKNGRRVFADNSFKILPIRMNQDGIDIEELIDSGTKLLYLSPSHQFPTGYIMPIGKRNGILNWAKKVNGIIIEDDYDSEFRYFGRPIPALKGLDSEGNVVYLSSFSKIIPPSIRMSYMVLPEGLLEFYQSNLSLYNQGASTLEQLALAKFMEDGHLEKQIRRLRKLYSEKSLILFAAIKDIMGNHVEAKNTESGLHMILTVKSELTSKELVQRALEKGCQVAPIQDYYWETKDEKHPQIILYFSRIPATKIREGIQLLKDAWF